MTLHLNLNKEEQKKITTVNELAEYVLAKSVGCEDLSDEEKEKMDARIMAKLKAGKKTGKATLTITLASGLKKQIKVKVQKKAVKTTKITGISKKTRLKKGKTLTLKPAVTPLTSLQKVTYKSSNKKVATVTSKGVIRARKKGTAVITVKSGRKTVKCRITVK